MGYDDKGGDFSGQLDRYHMNPMNDVLFKYTFGKEEHKDITIDLISSIFMDSGGNGINDLTFTSTEMIPQNADDKLSRLDVACELSDNLSTSKFRSSIITTWRGVRCTIGRRCI